MMKKMIWMTVTLLLLATPVWAQSMLLEKVTGDVRILKKGESNWVAAVGGTTLDPGDKIKTGEKSSVSIQWEKGTIKLDEKTDFAVKEYTVRDEQITTDLELTLGKLKAKVDKLNEGQTFRITTPTSVAAVRGTFFGLWVYEYLAKLYSRLDVWDGIVNFADIKSDENYDVDKGKYATGGEEGVTQPKDGEGEGEDEDFGGLDDDLKGNKNIEDAFNAQEGFDQDVPGSQDNDGNLFPDTPQDDESDKPSREIDNPKDDVPPPCRGPNC